MPGIDAWSTAAWAAMSVDTSAGSTRETVGAAASSHMAATANHATNRRDVLRRIKLLPNP
jgi:hypothetical protein